MIYCKLILVPQFLFLSILGKAQFNTLTFSSPSKEEKRLLPSKEIQKENKGFSLKNILNIGGKSKLRKEVDSLKEVIKVINSSKVIHKSSKNKDNDIQKIKDSLLSYYEKKQKENIIQTSIKRFDFVKEPEMGNLIPSVNTIYKFHMPLGSEMKITSPFGMRIHPVLGGIRMHNGIDLKANYEWVYSILDGIITDVGYEKRGGVFVKIRHSEKYETSYLHLSQVYCKVGDYVKAGHIIAKSGNTGTSTGPHLHFAVKEYGNYINPVKFLNEIVKLNNLISVNYEQFTNR